MKVPISPGRLMMAKEDIEAVFAGYGASPEYFAQSDDDGPTATAFDIVWCGEDNWDVIIRGAFIYRIRKIQNLFGVIDSRTGITELSFDTATAAVQFIIYRLMVKRPPPPRTFLGFEVVVDPDAKPGSIRFVPNGRDPKRPPNIEAIIGDIEMPAPIIKRGPPGRSIPIKKVD